MLPVAPRMIFPPAVRFPLPELSRLMVRLLVRVKSLPALKATMKPNVFVELVKLSVVGLVPVILMALPAWTVMILALVNTV